MKKEEVRARLEEIGIIPVVRVSSAEEARFAAEAVASGGIPIVEVTMTVPGANEVISHLVRSAPEIIVGAGSVLDIEMARLCVDKGAKFLTSEGFDPEVVEFAGKEGVVVFPGALTPTEVIAAWKAAADFVKVFPCAQLGGDSYIRALKAALPQVPLIAAGGVNQLTAGNLILAGAAALGVGRELIPKDAIQQRRAGWIRELAQRFLGLVTTARSQTAALKGSVVTRK
ncbi:MAG: bifunctional 4-hydroxy-2-oxoglutarate aldolase/2-dehydro-3-deoxy-phosphogluconate aldolase [Terriglobia bacterium]